MLNRLQPDRVQFRVVCDAVRLDEVRGALIHVALRKLRVSETCTMAYQFVCERARNPGEQHIPCSVFEHGPVSHADDVAEIFGVGLAPFAKGHVTDAAGDFTQAFRSDLRVGSPCLFIFTQEAAEFLFIDLLAAEQVYTRLADQLHAKTPSVLRGKTGRPAIGRLPLRIIQAMLTEMMTHRVLRMILLLSGVSTAVAQAPPRYRFEVGDWLVYERRETTGRIGGGEKIGATRTDQIQIWVLDRSDDLATILLDVIQMDGVTAFPMRGILAQVDGRGIRTVAPEFRAHTARIPTAFEVLPILRSATEASAAWTSEPDVLGDQFTYVERGPESGDNGMTRIDFHYVIGGGLRGWLDGTFEGAIWFDTASGRVARRASEYSSPMQGIQTRTETVLKHAVRNEERWTRQRLDETVRYVFALRQQDAVFAELLHNRTDWDTARPRLLRLWEGCVADLPRDAKSPVRTLAGAAREWIERDAPLWMRRTEYARRAIGRQAAPWLLQRSDGATVRSEELQDRWRIEVFWRGGQRESVRALLGTAGLPQAAALRWENPPFRVISMNLDSDGRIAARAAAVVPQIEFHLLAEPLNLLAPAPELPLIRLVDREGVVRAVWFGWHAWRTVEILEAIP